LSKKYLIGPSSQAEFATLQVIGNPTHPISITIQTTLTIETHAYFSEYTRLDVIRYLRLSASDANFTSDGVVVINGGNLFGNTFYLNKVNISSSSTIYLAYIKNIFFTPANPDLSCALLSSRVIVSDSIYCYSSVILDGEITSKYLIFNPVKPTYSLNIQGALTVNEAKFYNGNIATQSRNTIINSLELYNGITYRIASTARFSNVIGNGTLTLMQNTASVVANISDINIHIYFTFGTFDLGGTTCGTVYMSQALGFCYLYLSSGFVINTAIFRAGLVIGTVAHVNYLQLQSVTLQYIDLHVIKEASLILEYNQIILNGNLIIGPNAVVIQNYTLSVSEYNGGGQLINYGRWEINGNTTFLYGNLVGPGAIIINAAALQYHFPTNVTGSITILNGGKLGTNNNPGTYYFDTIYGDERASIAIEGQSVSIKNLTCNTFTDFTTYIATLGAFKINIYYAVSISTKNLISGTVRSFQPTQGSYTINLGGNVAIDSIALADGNRLNFGSNTAVTNFNFFGGTIAQTAGSGIFLISNTTYLSGYHLKFIDTTTVLHTRYLDCTSCSSPDCGLRISDWNHIVAGQTISCII